MVGGTATPQHKRAVCVCVCVRVISRPSRPASPLMVNQVLHCVYIVYLPPFLTPPRTFPSHSSYQACCVVQLVSRVEEKERGRERELMPAAPTTATTLKISQGFSESRSGSCGRGFGFLFLFLLGFSVWRLRNSGTVPGPVYFSRVWHGTWPIR